MKTVKQNRSKYNFGNLKAVGDHLFVDPSDLYSAMNSLTSFNKRHGQNIVLSVDAGSTDMLGRVKLVVTSI